MLAEFCRNVVEAEDGWESTEQRWRWTDIIGRWQQNARSAGCCRQNTSAELRQRSRQRPQLDPAAGPRTSPVRRLVSPRTARTDCQGKQQEIRDSRLSYGENPESLSHLGLNRYRVVTDGRTDGQTSRQNYDS